MTDHDDTDCIDGTGEPGPEHDDTDCIDGAGEPWPEHDWSEWECRRCGAESIE